jgi:hypothetical protein
LLTSGESTCWRAPGNQDQVFLGGAETFWEETAHEDDDKLEPSECLEFLDVHEAKELSVIAEE